MKANTIFLVPLFILYTTVLSHGATREQLSQLVEGLNDPDQIVRIVTLEEAVKSGDATLKRIAIRKAMQSTDTDLRALALRGALVDVKVLSFKLTPHDGIVKALEKAGEDDEAIRNVKNAYGNSFGMIQEYAHAMTVNVKEYDFNTGNITGYCMNNVDKPNDKYIATASVTGDNLSMVANCYTGSMYANCTLKAELNKSGKLEGVFGCKYGKAKAELDLL